MDAMKNIRKSARKKGFIGPIGDDLPSLIPLVFALMMFFYVFTSTWNIFDQRSRVFDDRIEALRVSNFLKGNYYLQNVEEFNQKCTEAKSVNRIKFFAGLLPLSTGPGQEFSGISLGSLEDDFFGEGEGKFLCSNVEEAPRADTPGMVIRSFPVALEFQNASTGLFYVRPMLLVVVTWR